MAFVGWFLALNSQQVVKVIKEVSYQREATFEVATLDALLGAMYQAITVDLLAVVVAWTQQNWAFYQLGRQEARG